MLFFRKPSESSIRSLLAERGAMTYSYPQVGATRSAPPAGWRINHLRLKAGSGRAKFDALAEALFSWKLLAIDGLLVFPSAPALQPGTDVAILSRHFGIWSVDFCRVIYVLQDEQEEPVSVIAMPSKSAATVVALERMLRRVQARRRQLMAESVA